MLVCEKMFSFKNIKTAYLIDCRLGLYGEKNELKKSKGQTKKWTGEKNRLKKIIG
jgi:hypothetical protein